MNGNDILLAAQNGCDLVLTTEGTVLYYKNAEGVDQELNIADITDATSLFSGNANIDVDWEVDIPNLTNSSSMFSGSSIKSFTSGNYRKNIASTNMFENCQQLKHVKADIPWGVVSGSSSFSAFSVDMQNMFTGCGSLKSVHLKALKRFSPGRTSAINVKAQNMFIDCVELESVKINYQFNITAHIWNFKDMFKNCRSLKNININLGSMNGNSIYEGMFSGCVLGPDELQQIANWRFTTSTTSETSITIGVDSTKVTQKDIDEIWYPALSKLGFGPVWEFNTPETNTPVKLMAKSAPVKFYRLAEIDEESLEYISDAPVYTKDGKYYLVTAGDYIVEHGSNSELLRNTEIGGVVEARSPEEAVEKLGAVLLEN